MGPLMVILVKGAEAALTAFLIWLGVQQFAHGRPALGWVLIAIGCLFWIFNGEVSSTRTITK